ncbi:MAG TPA: hypothetical protein VI318_06465 [Baekduia sp.]
MPLPADLALIVLGVLLVACSRVIADRFKVAHKANPLIKFAGLADDPASALHRWITAVGVGVFFIVAGIYGLAS